MSFLKVSGIGKKEGTTFALKDIIFGQERFRHMVIAGETGSGKSTLLKIIGGITSPEKGAVYFEGDRVKKVPEEKLIPGHPGIAYLSQHFELRNHYRMEELLEYANILGAEKASRIYSICQIDHLLKRKSDQLSGGEKQRIALARLLVSAPRLLLLDEPFSNLDMIHKNQLKAVLRDIGDEMGMTTLLVSHDPLDTLSWADEILILRNGMIHHTGTPQAVYRQPPDAYVAGLFGVCYPVTEDLLRFFPVLNTLAVPDRHFLRPEDFIITTANKDVTATVSKVLFCGSYLEIEATLPGMKIMLRSMNFRIKQGDVISLALRPDFLKK
jgi:ABC-type sulfate/molybdate transport systems ATPase subunit